MSQRAESAITVVMRCPGRKGQPRPAIPSRAEEKIPGYDNSGTNAYSDKKMTDLAEAYGYGKNSQAKPAGTGILVGGTGTVIEIVFYRISGDLQTGDGVGRDNKGQYYRIFMSTESN